MFRSALFKLAAVYVGSAMVLSLTFSAVLYHFATHELDEGLHNQYHHFVDKDHDTDTTESATRPELLARSNHLKEDLLYFNCIVLAGSIVLGYILAKRTLKPIEAAHTDQLRFTAEASHELRTPITAMKADTESILSLKRPSYRQLKDTLISNLNDIERLEALTNHLLYMGRFKFQKQPSAESVSLKEAVENSLRLVERKYKDKNIAISIELQDQRILGDKIALEQLLTIVIDNAFKYSKKDGEINFASKKGSVSAQLTITDSGVGIAAKDLPHIFEHFYRSADNTGPHASGYGLGLSLAKDIAEYYGGSLSVTSVKNKGTSVTISLPKGR